ncbi:hypothetical protein [Brevibacillus migulae]|uniref:hypothetical protein n=1 Tax=Brevibacillus migulae TaxID=1644114 RepID=UPI00106EF0CF|nr:hypothetical protein [Brevibacillus migulae]
MSQEKNLFKKRVFFWPFLTVSEGINFSINQSDTARKTSAKEGLVTFFERASIEVFLTFQEPRPTKQARLLVDGDS